MRVLCYSPLAIGCLIFSTLESSKPFNAEHDLHRLLLKHGEDSRFQIPDSLFLEQESFSTEAYYKIPLSYINVLHIMQGYFFEC